MIDQAIGWLEVGIQTNKLSLITAESFDCVYTLVHVKLFMIKGQSFQVPNFRNF